MARAALDWAVQHPDQVQSACERAWDNALYGPLGPVRVADLDTIGPGVSLEIRVKVGGTIIDVWPGDHPPFHGHIQEGKYEGSKVAVATGEIADRSGRVIGKLGKKELERLQEELAKRGLGAGTPAQAQDPDATAGGGSAGE